MQSAQNLADMKVSVSKAAQALGVHPDTLRRWEAKGRLEVERTVGGHRRFNLDVVKKRVSPASPKRATLCYARVSGHDQKSDLKRQIELLESYCAAKGWLYETIEDLGSGLNDHKKGLQQLIKRIGSADVERLVLTHKDRLMRFGSELIFSICEFFGTEVVILNAKEEASFEDDLVQDVLEILTVFSARLYGARSHKNRQLLEALQETADGH